MNNVFKVPTDYQPIWINPKFQMVFYKKKTHHLLLVSPVGEETDEHPI